MKPRKPGNKIQPCARLRSLTFAALALFHTGLTFPLGAQTFPWEPFPIGQVAVQTDDKILISGRFQQIDGVPKTNLARLNIDGSLDRSFNAEGVERIFDQGINWLALQPDGKILVAGWSSRGIVRFESDGRVDPGFHSPQLDQTFGLLGVQGGAIQSDGRILIFGQFGGVAGEVRDGIARLDPDGTLDRSFNPRLLLRGTTGKPEVLVVQSDGKILMGGQFDNVNATPRSMGLARLNPDGSLDPLFNPSGPFSFVPLLLAVTPAEKVYVNSLLGVTRLNPDGSLDNQFNPGFGISRTNDFTQLATLALQPDGRLLLGGDFHFYDAIPRAGLARVLPDGSLDAGFDAQLLLSPQVQSWDDHSVYVGAISVQTGGGIVIGGTFTGAGGISRSWLARLDANGEPDKSFHAFRPIIQAASLDANGLLTMRITGEFGRPYRVEESADLILWRPLRNFLILGEAFEFVDVRKPLLPRVFYRVHSD